MKKTKTVPKALGKEQYEELGKIVASVYETGYLDHAKSYRMSFFKGVLQGFGGVIGATILVGLLLWVLSFMDEVPFVGRLIDNAEDTINTQQ